MECNYQLRMHISKFFKQISVIDSKQDKSIPSRACVGWNVKHLKKKPALVTSRVLPAKRITIPHDCKPSTRQSHFCHSIAVDRNDGDAREKRAYPLCITTCIRTCIKAVQFNQCLECAGRIRSHRNLECLRRHYSHSHIVKDYIGTHQSTTA